MNEITQRSTKQEILEAYQKFVEDKSDKGVSLGAPQGKKKGEEVGSEDKGKSVEKTVGAIKELQGVFNASAERLVNAVEEFRKRRGEEEERFGIEMNNKKRQWSQEQEEYEYRKKVERKRDEDEYIIKKQVLERELQERLVIKEEEIKKREQFLKEQEDEIKALRKQAEAFPAELKKEVDEVAKHTKADMEANAKIDQELKTKDNEREREIAKLKISSLEETIKQQTSQITSLERQLAQASSKAQELAVKVIESGKRLLFEEEKSNHKNKE